MTENRALKRNKWKNGDESKKDKRVNGLKKSSM